MSIIEVSSTEAQLLEAVRQALNFGRGSHRGHPGHTSRRGPKQWCGGAAVDLRSGKEIR